MTPAQIKIKKRKDHGRWLARRSSEFKEMKARTGEEILWESLGQPVTLDYYDSDRRMHSAWFYRLDTVGCWFLIDGYGIPFVVDFMRIRIESLLLLA